MNFYIYVCLILEFENMCMLIIIRIVLRVLYLRYLFGLGNRIFLLYSIIVKVYDWILEKYYNLRFV